MGFFPLTSRRKADILVVVVKKEKAQKEKTVEILDVIMDHLVEISIMIFELIGVSVLVAAGLMGLYNYIRRDPLTRLKLAKGMAMGLEFKLGSEILRTVVVRDFSEIMIVGAIILLRAALTFLIHWEIKNEEAHEIVEASTEAKEKE